MFLFHCIWVTNLAPLRADVEKRCAVYLFFPSNPAILHATTIAYCIVLILHDDLVTAYGTGRHNSLELRGFFRSNESKQYSHTHARV